MLLLSTTYNQIIMIASFDALAATKCAEMMASYRSDEELKRYSEENKITKATIKYDH